MQYGIPSTEFRRTLTIFCNQGPNVRASIHLLELFILNEYAARYTVARHYLGQYSDICDLVSYPPSFSESHLFVCDFHFSLHSDPFQYDPKKDLVCICMGDKAIRRLSLQLSYLAFRELYRRDEKRYKIVSK